MLRRRRDRRPRLRNPPVGRSTARWLGQTGPMSASPSVGFRDRGGARCASPVRRPRRLGRPRKRCWCWPRGVTVRHHLFARLAAPPGRHCPIWASEPAAAPLEDVGALALASKVHPGGLLVFEGWMRSGKSATTARWRARRLRSDEAPAPGGGTNRERLIRLSCHKLKDRPAAAAMASLVPEGRRPQIIWRVV